jgi:hypothetical protein
MKPTTNRRIRRARSADEIERFTAEFDGEGAVSEFHALSREDRKRWERVQRKPGRPRKDRSVKVISLRVEQTLLARADALARRIGVTRAGLFERGLKAVIAAQGDG